MEFPKYDKDLKSKNFENVFFSFFQEDSTKKHTGLVILPLKALMKDTISSLREHNIPAYGLLEDAEKDLAGTCILI